MDQEYVKLTFPVKMEWLFVCQKYIVENPVYVIKLLMTGEMEAQASNEESGIATRTFLLRDPKSVRLHPVWGEQDYALLCTTTKSQQYHWCFPRIVFTEGRPFSTAKLDFCIDFCNTLTQQNGHKYIHSRSTYRISNTGYWRSDSIPSPSFPYHSVLFFPLHLCKPKLQGVISVWMRGLVSETIYQDYEKCRVYFYKGNSLYP